jgi:diguanylate cyclase (GGDEF)-like protein
MVLLIDTGLGDYLSTYNKKKSHERPNYNFDRDIRKKRRKEDLEKKTRKPSYTVLYFRWAVTILLILIPILINPVYINFWIMFFAVLIIAYNAYITYYTVEKRKSSKEISMPVLCADVIILSIMTIVSGGIKSDAYLFIILYIGYFGILKDSKNTFKFAIFSSLAYIMAVILSTDGDFMGFNGWVLFYRVSFIVITAFAVSMLNKTVSEYDELHKKEFVKARTDKLTGLLNRHFMDQRLNEEIRYSQENNAPINAILFDLDNFKMFNDTYGHVWGDKLLVLFADIMKQCIRRNDKAVRYGGEEFLILIRDLDIHIVRSVADRIRTQLERQRLYIGSDESRRRVTVSCGIAQYPKHGGTMKKVIDCADKGLYYAKETGKNKIVMFDEIPEDEKEK